jgi:hypothetical protein
MHNAKRSFNNNFSDDEQQTVIARKEFSVVDK